ncbi:MAG: hypothetical protein AAF829_09990 [Pseudomonadota bacterium]
MPSISVRKLDEKTIAALRSRAARNGVSMEEEVRRILKSAASHTGESAGDIMVRIFSRSWDGDAFEVPEDDFTDPDVTFS